MADGSTTNLSFTLPEVGFSDDTWGGKLNANWTQLDGYFPSARLRHESGGLEADVSAYSGLIKISGGATSQVTITAAGEALLDDADAAAQRTTLGLGAVATLASIATTNLASPTGTDTNVVTGTAGTSGNLAQWDANGDAVDSSVASSAVVTLTGSQALTNKTLTSPAINAPTISAPVVNTPASTNWSGSASLDPANGDIQDITLTGNVASLTDSMADGESIVLQINDGTAYTITWPTITWVSGGGTAPTLQTTGDTIISIWKNGTTLFGFAANGA